MYLGGNRRWVPLPNCIFVFVARHFEFLLDPSLLSLLGNHTDRLSMLAQRKIVLPSRIFLPPCKQPLVREIDPTCGEITFSMELLIWSRLVYVQPNKTGFMLLNESTYILTEKPCHKFHFISFLLINPNLQFYFLTAHKKQRWQQRLVQVGNVHIKNDYALQPLHSLIHK